MKAFGFYCERLGKTVTSLHCERMRALGKLRHIEYCSTCEDWVEIYKRAEVKLAQQLRAEKEEEKSSKKKTEKQKTKPVKKKEEKPPKEKKQKKVLLGKKLSPERLEKLIESRLEGGGNCTICGKPLANYTDNTECSLCKKKRGDYTKREHSYRLGKKCSICGREISDKSQGMCRECANKTRATMEREFRQMREENDMLHDKIDSLKILIEQFWRVIEGRDI